MATPSVVFFNPFRNLYGGSEQECLHLGKTSEDRDLILRLLALKMRYSTVPHALVTVYSENIERLSMMRKFHRDRC